MSPLSPTVFIPDSCFPRVSGDEPKPIDIDLNTPSFSPRERG